MAIRLTVSFSNEAPTATSLADVFGLGACLLFFEILANLVLHRWVFDSVDYADAPALVQDE